MSSAVPVPRSQDIDLRLVSAYAVLSLRFRLGVPLSVFTVTAALGLTTSESRVAALLAENLKVHEITTAQGAGASPACAGWSSSPAVLRACRGRLP